MNQQVRQLFHELADVPAPERERILAGRGLAPDVRAELESLLSFDRDGDDSLTSSVSSVAESALRDLDADQLGECGPYRLVRLLGSGGMGAVYLGERSDGEIQQRVAVKLLRAGADRPAWRDRFLRERQLLAWLNHPAIARLLDAGHLPGGQPYLVMEYVDGVTIDAWCEGRDLRDILTLFLRVCDGVSHAHRHLIIHRDLKPSNILVDAAGQPKLLDFGIAKLLDDTVDATRTVERMMTPHYASPEQVRGDVQTTATDVYSLGAVLHKLVKGRSPRETGPSGATPPARVPNDIEFVLRKALRDEPDQRYASAEALAADVRRYLQWRPVEARSGDAWYRARRFLRRSWLPLSAAVVTTAGLSAGIYVANHQRAIAQRRFVLVRQLANKVLALDDQLGAIPGATKIRHQVVAMSGEYLDALRADARGDRDLTLEIGRAFLLLGRAQGVPIVSNLGQYAQAGESLRKAESLVEPLVATAPRDRAALLTSAEIAHDQMILADSNRHDAQALVFARKVVSRAEAVISLGPLPPGDVHNLGRLLTNVELAFKNQHQYGDAIRIGRRVIEVDPTYRSAAMSVIADSLRLAGDLDGALEAVRQSRAAFDRGTYNNTYSLDSNLFSSLWREGVILGEAGMINLGRPDEAIAVLQKALDVAEQWARKDPNESSSRLHMANAAWKLGDILCERDAHRALAVYDLGLARLREVKGNATARRQEVQLLAASSYALTRLGRGDEAGSRVDAAMRLLQDAKAFPAARIEPGSEVDQVMRAQADHLAATGQTGRAAQICSSLLEKMMAARPDPTNDLRHAVRLSDLYAALAAFDHRIGRNQEADELKARRIGIWRGWEAKLPGNPWIRRQLEAALVG
jgi:serine/threonine protein kinase